MAFMNNLNNLRSTPMPPMKNVLNVALQTAKQHLPHNSRSTQSPVFDPNASEGPPPVPPRPQSVRFADSDGECWNFRLLAVRRAFNFFLYSP
jgi:hypothetical protein